MIHIYYAYIREENHENLLKSELMGFPCCFQKKIEKYKRWEDAQLSLLGRILLFSGIREVYNIDLKNEEIVYTKYKKPFFKHNAIQFNISHSGQIVVCAISELEIGIDLEIICKIDLTGFKSQMSNNEWNNIIGSNNVEEAFFIYWTRKEAVIKANGLGQIIAFKSFEIIQNSVIIKNQKFYVDEIKIDKRYKCSISSKNELVVVFLKELNFNV